MRTIGMEVRVLREGVFNGPNHRALPRAKVGKVIVVAGLGYAESLIADGWVARLKVDADISLEEDEGTASEPKLTEPATSVEGETLEESILASTEAGDDVLEISKPETTDIKAGGTAVGLDDDEGEGEDEGVSTAEGAMKIELEAIHGIGPAIADNLRHAGIQNVGELVAADWQAINSAVGGTRERIMGWQDHGRELLAENEV